MSQDPAWYFARGDAIAGPVSLAELLERLPEVSGDQTLIYGPGLSDWIEARHVQVVIEGLSGYRGPPPLPEGPRSDVIDYEIFGDETQFVEITLDPGETVIAEAGAMMYTTPGIVMNTIMGDPAEDDDGFIERLKTAGRRWLTGESLFLTTYTNEADERRRVAFAAPYPGKIVPLHLEQLGGEIICQKDAFIAAARGVEIAVALQRRLGVGLFGGEGFVMQRLVGDGLAFVHAGGALLQRRLEPGEQLKLDTGCLVALTPQVDFSIEHVGGVRNMLFGGEGIFFATLTGPGQIWCQSLPFSRFAARVVSGSRVGKGEGSVLGGVGRFVNGDERE